MLTFFVLRHQMRHQISVWLHKHDFASVFSVLGRREGYYTRTILGVCIKISLDYASLNHQKPSRDEDTLFFFKKKKFTAQIFLFWRFTRNLNVIDFLSNYASNLDIIWIISGGGKKFVSQTDVNQKNFNNITPPRLHTFSYRIERFYSCLQC